MPSRQKCTKMYNTYADVYLLYVLWWLLAMLLGAISEYPATRKVHYFETRGPRYRAQYMNEY